MPEDAPVSSHHADPEAQKQELAHETIRNVAAPGVPYFTPKQSPVSINWLQKYSTSQTYFSKARRDSHRPAA